MNFDFPAFLVLASAVTGGIWLIDALFFAPGRRRRVEESVAAGDKAAVYREPVLVEYARSFFPVIFIVLLLRSFLVEPFRIPSNSMMPTLLTGDFILVNKFDYGLRWPVLNTKFWGVGEPKRGDVIVFKWPGDNRTDYIKRVVGVPGDEIWYRDKTVYVNGKPQPQLPIGPYIGVGSGAVMTGARESIEDLDGVEHDILVRPQSPDMPGYSQGCYFWFNEHRPETEEDYEAFRKQALPGPVAWGRPPPQPEMRKIVVPKGHYFVMGDNRDNSNDSRCWGFVPDHNLVGKAFLIWMSWDGQREGFPPVAWSRLGETIK